jgi:hypothetical protein
MRPVTTDLRALLAAGHFEVWARLYLPDPTAADRTVADSLVATMGGDGDKLLRGTISESLDAPVMSAEFTVARGATASVSFAPLIGASALNANGTLLRPATAVRLTVACVAPETTPVDADFVELFTGRVDTVDFAGDPDGIVLHCRDTWSRALDLVRPTGAKFGTEAGRRADLVIWDILTAFVLADLPDLTFGDATVGSSTSDTIYVPVDPTFLATETWWDAGSVLEQMRSYAQFMGWDLRGRYTADGTFPLTLYEPARTTTTADATFGPDEYTAVPQGAIDLSDVRNVVEVLYPPDYQGVEVFDEASLEAYGYRFMRLPEDRASAIDTESQATDMADAILADLKDPPLDMTVETLLFWPAQLNDYYTFAANGELWDVDQSAAVLALTHTLEGGHGATSFTLKGKPCAAYRAWLGGERRRVHTALTDPPTTGEFPEGTIWCKTSDVSFP